MDTIEINASDINTIASHSKMMTDTDKAMNDPTLATHQKVAAFTSLEKVEAKRSIGGHKSHLTRTREAAHRAVTAVADISCPATIKNMERCLEAYYTKADDGTSLRAYPSS